MRIILTLIFFLKISFIFSQDKMSGYWIGAIHSKNLGDHGMILIDDDHLYLFNIYSNTFIDTLYKDSNHIFDSLGNQIGELFFNDKILCVGNRGKENEHGSCSPFSKLINTKNYVSQGLINSIFANKNTWLLIQIDNQLNLVQEIELKKIKKNDIDFEFISRMIFLRFKQTLFIAEEDRVENVAPIEEFYNNKIIIKESTNSASIKIKFHKIMEGQKHIDTARERHY